MAKFKALKIGFTDINSTDISDFSIHSDYKCQKIASVNSTTVTLPAGSNSINGDSASTTIAHNLGYIPIFFAFIQYNGKGYEAVGNANPQIPVQQMQLYSSDITNNYISATSSKTSYVSTASHVSVGDTIRFSLNPGDTSLVAPLQENTNYYVVNIVDSSNFQISTSLGGPVLDLTAHGVGPYSDIFTNITHPYFGAEGVGFNINADTTNLNVTVFPTGLGYIANDETFGINSFFILDEII